MARGPRSFSCREPRIKLLVPDATQELGDLDLEGTLRGDGRHDDDPVGLVSPPGPARCRQAALPDVRGDDPGEQVSDLAVGVPHVPADQANAETLAAMLRRRGCVVVDSLFAESHPAVRAELERVVADGRLGTDDFDGHATRRVYDPLARTRALDELLLHPVVTATVEAMIGAAQFGMTVLSDIQPGEVTQRLHRDASVYPLPAGAGPVMVNTIWAVDDFTADNGATLLAPASHLDTRAASAYDPASLVPAEMRAGSVLFYDGRLVHGAGGNATSSARLGLIVEYILRWLRPGDNHTLTVARELAATLPTGLQELLGYNQRGAYFGFVAGRPPLEWLKASPTVAR